MSHNHLGRPTLNIGKFPNRASSHKCHHDAESHRRPGIRVPVCRRRTPSRASQRARGHHSTLWTRPSASSTLVCRPARDACSPADVADALVDATIGSTSPTLADMRLYEEIRLRRAGPESGCRAPGSRERFPRDAPARRSHQHRPRHQPTAVGLVDSPPGAPRHVARRGISAQTLRGDRWTRRTQSPIPHERAKPCLRQCEPSADQSRRSP